MPFCDICRETAHDVNNILMGLLIVSTSLATKEVSPEKQLEHSKELEKYTNQISSLVNKACDESCKFIAL